MQDEKQDKIVDQFQKALDTGREAKVTGAIQVTVNLSQGGIRDAKVTVQRQVV